jgi:DNA-binding response OmpR family regulator
MSAMESERHRRALIVEGDTAVRRLLRGPLDDLGLAVQDVGDGIEGLREASSGRFDVLLFDVASPGLDGIALCRAVRRSGPNVDTPLLLVSRHDREADAVRGFDCGADDFVAAPFRPRELQARVGALLRRHGRVTTSPPPLAAVPISRLLRLDPHLRAVLAPGRTIALTPREFAVLQLLAARRDDVVSRTRLQREIWGADMPADNRVVDVLVSRLRKKLEPNPRRPRLIRTAWGVGYRLTSAD